MAAYGLQTPASDVSEAATPDAYDPVKNPFAERPSVRTPAGAFSKERVSPLTPSVKSMMRGRSTSTADSAGTQGMSASPDSAGSSQPVSSEYVDSSDEETTPGSGSLQQRLSFDGFRTLGDTTPDSAKERFPVFMALNPVFQPGHLTLPDSASSRGALFAAPPSANSTPALHRAASASPNPSTPGYTPGGMRPRAPDNTPTAAACPEATQLPWSDVKTALRTKAGGWGAETPPAASSPAAATAADEEYVRSGAQVAASSPAACAEPVAEASSSAPCVTRGSEAVSVGASPDRMMPCEERCSPHAETEEEVDVSAETQAEADASAETEEEADPCILPCSPCISQASASTADTPAEAPACLAPPTLPEECESPLLEGSRAAVAGDACVEDGDARSGGMREEDARAGPVAKVVQQAEAPPEALSGAKEWGYAILDGTWGVVGAYMLALLPVVLGVCLVTFPAAVSAALPHLQAAHARVIEALLRWGVEPITFIAPAPAPPSPYDLFLAAHPWIPAWAAGAAWSVAGALAPVAPFVPSPGAIASAVRGALPSPAWGVHLFAWAAPALPRLLSAASTLLDAAAQGLRTTPLPAPYAALTAASACAVVLTTAAAIKIRARWTAPALVSAISASEDEVAEPEVSEISFAPAPSFNFATPVGDALDVTATPLTALSLSTHHSTVKKRRGRRSGVPTPPEAFALTPERASRRIHTRQTDAMLMRDL